MQATSQLSAPQRRVMQLLQDGGGQVHLTSVRGSKQPTNVLHTPLQSLSRRGLIRYVASGGWVSITTPDRTPEEPMEHKLREWLDTVLKALSTFPGGRTESHWDLLDACKRFGFSNYHTMEEALRYGERKGLVKLGRGHNYSQDSRGEWFIEKV
jgi:hypothetical protein